jgi:hypothetical protein
MSTVPCLNHEQDLVAMATPRIRSPVQSLLTHQLGDLTPQGAMVSMRTIYFKNRKDLRFAHSAFLCFHCPKQQKATGHSNGDEMSFF